MAVAVTRIFQKSSEYFDDETLAVFRRLGKILQADWIHFIESVEDSKHVSSFSGLVAVRTIPD